MNKKSNHNKFSHNVNSKFVNYHWQGGRNMRFHDPQLPPMSEPKKENYSKIDNIELKPGQDIVSELNKFNESSGDISYHPDEINKNFKQIKNWGRGSGLTKAPRTILNNARYETENTRFHPIVRKPLIDPVQPFKTLNSRDYKRDKISENTRVPIGAVRPYPLVNNKLFKNIDK